MSDAGSSGKHYLAGETVEEWQALSLRNLWTVEDTVQLLKTGQNRFATVAGNMVDVIHHSTQHFSDDDLTAIARYLKSLPPGKDDLPMPSVAHAPAAPPADLFTSRGGLGYMQFCSDCHRSDGAGVKGLFPPLAGNPSIASNNPTSLLHITLTGWETAQTAAHPRVYTMPGFARLADQEIAEILSFVRTRWGNEGTPISAAQVKKLRDQLNPATTDSSAFETPRLADLLAAPNADQVVRGMRLHLQTKALLPDNVGNALNCTSCHLNAGTRRVAGEEGRHANKRRAVRHSACVQMAAGAVECIANVIRQQRLCLQVQAHAAHHLVGVGRGEQVGQARGFERR